VADKQGTLMSQGVLGHSVQSGWETGEVVNLMRGFYVAP
jgi:hypothetical protein